MTRTFAARLTAFTVAAALALTSCSSSSGDNRPTITPATPAASPEVVGAPAGRVEQAAAGEGLAFDPVWRRLAAIAGNEVVLYSVDGGFREVGKVSAFGPVNQVVPGRDGGFLVAAQNRVLMVDRDGAAKSVQIDGDALTAVPYERDGSVALAGTADGRILRLSEESVLGTIDGLVETSLLRAHDGAVAAIDRRQASISEVDVADGKLGRSLRIGRGVTNAAMDDYGRMLTVDTGQNQVLAYTVEPFMQRFMYPVPNSPWAVDYDESAKLMWVTETASNEVVGFALGSGMPEQKKRYPTVRQPNAIAVDAKTGTLYVQSATGGGIQVIETT